LCSLSDSKKDEKADLLNQDVSKNPYFFPFCWFCGCSVHRDVLNFWLGCCFEFLAGVLFRIFGGGAQGLGVSEMASQSTTSWGFTVKVGSLMSLLANSVVVIGGSL
jgi:hypothetical protein